MHTGDITKTNPKNSIFRIFGHPMIFTFKLVTFPKTNDFTFVQKCTNDKILVKIRQCTPDTDMMKNVMQGQMDTYGRT